MTSDEGRGRIHEEGMGVQEAHGLGAHGHGAGHITIGVCVDTHTMIGVCKHTHHYRCV